MAKGQWFILSAVVASFVFLTLSTFFRGYYIIDTSSIPLCDEDFIMWNIVSELNKTITQYATSDGELAEYLDKLINLAEENYRSLGYYVDINITSPVHLSGTSFKILIKTHQMIIEKDITLP